MYSKKDKNKSNNNEEVKESFIPFSIPRLSKRIIIDDALSQKSMKKSMKKSKIWKNTSVPGLQRLQKKRQRWPEPSTEELLTLSVPQALNVLSKHEKKEIDEKIFTDFKTRIRASFTYVLKFGTNAITTNNRVDETKLDRIAALVKKMKDEGKNIVIITSGAIACGMEINKITEKPKDIDELQDLAAEGQILLMERYRKAFSKYNIGVWQILLTHHNFSTQKERTNVISRIERAWQRGKVPILNTNDPVTKEELLPVNGKNQDTFSDNDPLAAIVTKNLGADCLVIVSDKGRLGSGGRNSKIRAIKIARKNGALVAICRFDNLAALLNGKKCGEIFY